MRRDKFVRFDLRVPQEIAKVIYAMSNKERSAYKVLCDIVTSFARAEMYPPLREDTMCLLYQVAELAKYSSADELAQDLCRSLERTIRANRGALQVGEPEVDNDIVEMFNSVLNEKEVTIRKHT